ncbi:hypothetical protein [Planococcus lenghuensis]|nr:hypothetical protein [Planococcus lenghuensis]
MDKLMAIVVSIVAVVAIASVILFNGLLPAMDAKTDAFQTQMTNSNYTGN